MQKSRGRRRNVPTTVFWIISNRPDSQRDDRILRDRCLVSRDSLWTRSRIKKKMQQHSNLNFGKSAHKKTGNLMRILEIRTSSSIERNITKKTQAFRRQRRQSSQQTMRNPKIELLTFRISTTPPIDVQMLHPESKARSWKSFLAKWSSPHTSSDIISQTKDFPTFSDERTRRTSPPDPLCPTDRPKPSENHQTTFLPQFRLNPRTL